MGDFLKVLSGLDILLMVFVGALLRHFFVRLRKSEDDLGVIKTKYVSREYLDNLFDLKFAPTVVRLQNIENILNKISSTIPKISIK